MDALRAKSASYDLRLSDAREEMLDKFARFRLGYMQMGRQFSEKPFIIKTVQFLVFRENAPNNKTKFPEYNLRSSYYKRFRHRTKKRKYSSFINLVCGHIICGTYYFATFLLAINRTADYALFTSNFTTKAKISCGSSLAYGFNLSSGVVLGGGVVATVVKQVCQVLSALVATHRPGNCNTWFVKT